MNEQHHAPVSVETMAHAFEEEAAPVDLSAYAVEDWVNMAIFWAMAASVFLQFFTRYALNNSLAWTEEIAANCLVLIVFVGSIMCVRMARHIQVDFIYNFVSPKVARGLELLVDFIVIGFFAYMTWLMWRYIAIVGNEQMVTINLPRGYVFYTVFAAFALMLARSIQNFVKDMINEKSVREKSGEAGMQGV